MRTILFIALIATIILAGCGGSNGEPITESPLGDDLENQADVKPATERNADEGTIRINAQLGADSCNIDASVDAVGDCDYPEELMCDGTGERLCDVDCMDYLENYNDGCLKNWMDANYADIGSEKEYCFREDSHYDDARTSSICNPEDDNDGNDETTQNDAVDACADATLSCPGTSDCDDCGECLDSGDPECTNPDPCPNPGESRCIACGDTTCETSTRCATLKAVCE